MKNVNWVLGHKVTTLQVTGDYDLALGLTPGNIPGPPPHYHSKYSEVFLILEGEMEFIVEGESKILRTDESIDLPPNTIHTFSNKSDSPCKWINIHSPKGFSSFFMDIGIPENEADAMKKSVDESIIKRVMETAASYDMHIQL